MFQAEESALRRAGKEKKLQAARALLVEGKRAEADTIFRSALEVTIDMEHRLMRACRDLGVGALRCLSCMVVNTSCLYYICA